MNDQLCLGSSLVWQKSDLQIGFHAYCYGKSHYDGFLHTHQEYSVLNCLSGSMCVHAEGADYFLSAGETFIVNSGVPHCCSFGDDPNPSSGLTVWVAPHRLRELCAALGFCRPDAAFAPFFRQKLKDAQILSCANAIIKEFLSKERGSGLVLELLATQMLVYLLRRWPSSDIETIEHSVSSQLPWIYMHRATEYMNTHGKGDFRISRLCQEIGLSSSRFIPLFTSSTSLSPHTYYNRLLVHKAKRLLAEGCAPTKEIAYFLGFKSVSHFCAMYLKLTGAPPQSAPSEISSFSSAETIVPIQEKHQL